MKKLLISVFIHLSYSLVYSQNNIETVYSREIQEKIQEVEKSICLTTFQIEGQESATTIEERMKAYGVKGVSIAVINNYQLDWAKGYGFADSAEQRLVTTETLFQAASISKSLNAMAMLKMVQEGKVSLNVDINEYLKSWQFPYKSKISHQNITIENLLSHTAGLNVHGFAGYHSSDSLPTTLQILNGTRPSNSEAILSVTKPNKYFSYSGGGTTITQLIQMDNSKMPYDQYMQEKVLSPLGMLSSSYSQPMNKSRSKEMATGYTIDGKEVDGKYYIYPEQAPAGLWTTPSELSQFIIETQLSLEGKSNKILSKEMTEKMLTPIKEDAALGVFIENRDGVKYFQHSGANEGFRGIYYGSMKDGYGVVVFTNSDNGGVLMNEIVNAVSMAYKWKGFYKDKKIITKKEILLPDSLSKKYVGSYKLNNELYDISLENKQLKYNTGSGSWKMYFTSPTEFINIEASSIKTFLLDSLGKVIGFIKIEGENNLGSFQKVNIIEVPEIIKEKLLGNYNHGQQDLKIIEENKDLFLFFDDENKMKLIFLSETEFYLENDHGAFCILKLDKKNQKILSIVRVQGDHKIVIKKTE